MWIPNGELVWNRGQGDVFAWKNRVTQRVHRICSYSGRLPTTPQPTPKLKDKPRDLRSERSVVLHRTRHGRPTSNVTREVHAREIPWVGLKPPGRSDRFHRSRHRLSPPARGKWTPADLECEIPSFLLPETSRCCCASPTCLLPFRSYMEVPKKNKRQATLTSSFTANGSFKNKSVCTSGENGHPRQTGKSEANAATNGYDLYKALGGLEARQGETRFERGDKTAVNCCTSFHFLVTFSCKVCDLGASVDKVSVVDSSQIPDSAAFYP